MKKRLLSLLLTVCLLAAMFSVLGTTASAADDKIVGYLTGYTMKAGDTIYDICKAKGIDFNMNINKILAINGITNANWLYPGTRLWLTTSTADTSATYYTLLAHVLTANETPASLCQEYGIDYNTNLKLLSALNTNLNSFIVGQTIVLPLQVNPVGPVTPTPAPTPTPQPGTSPSPTAAPDPKGDTLSYYLAMHVLQYGETVSGICAAMGVNFAKYSDLIMRINKITSYNFLLPGQVLLIPTTTVPTGSYYKVMAHTVVAGDTVYNLCISYGLNFFTYQTLIEKLNNVNNLTSFYVGQTLYMPFYVAGGGGGKPTVTPTPRPTLAPGTTATPTPAPTPTPQPGIGGDTVSYYLAAHVLQYGETVSGICAAMGVDFNALQFKIAQYSGITNYSYLLPGKTILIPMKTVPTGSYYKVMAHTVAAGDTVYNLCVSYGLNYFTYSSLIQALNSTTSLTNFYVGQTLYLPVYVSGAKPSADPSKTTPAPGSGTITGTITAVTGSTLTVNGIVFGYKGASLEGQALVGATATVTYTESGGVYSATKVVISKGGGTASPGAVTPSPTPKIEIPEGDTLSYYVANCVVQTGETISSICANLGVDYNAVANDIIRLSNIQNVNNVRVGQTVRIPMTTVPKTSHYKIMEHQLKAGDTMYDLAIKYGLNYNTSLDFLQRLNNTTNLANYYVGQTVYLPLYVPVK